MITFRTSSVADTKKLARRLSKVLKPGDVVLLVAGLGSGKTTFVQGAAAYWGAGTATSPTFILAQTLRGRRGTFIHHLDFYRAGKSDALSFGVEDYLAGRGEIPRGIVFIEWADRFPQLWPEERLEIGIRIDPKSTDRLFTFKAVGSSYKKKLKAFGSK